jgi:hypothetical protein
MTVALQTILASCPQDDCGFTNNISLMSAGWTVALQTILNSSLQDERGFTNNISLMSAG